MTRILLLQLSTNPPRAPEAPTPVHRPSRTADRFLCAPNERYAPGLGVAENPPHPCTRAKSKEGVRVGMTPELHV